MKLKALVIAGALLVAGAANAQESYVQTPLTVIFL